MNIHKLKINDSKTVFIVFRYPQLRCDISGLSVNVGESQITQWLKVRNIGENLNLLSYNACSTIIHALIICWLD